MLVVYKNKTVNIFLMIALAVTNLLWPLCHVSDVQAAVNPSESEYLISIGPITGSTAGSYNYATLFNPAGSGATVVVKHLSLRSYGVAAAVWQNLTIRRISAASGGTQIPASAIPKKNSSSSNSVLEIRHTNVTATLSGTTDSRLMSVVAASNLGSAFSTKDIYFGDNENLVLQPGEGIVLYQEAAGDTDQQIILLAEWDEQASAPAAQNEYLFSFPRVEFAATANYAYNTFFNPSASGKYAVIKRLSIDVDCDAAAVYTNNISIRRITTSTAGTAIAASNVPKKNSSSASSSMEFRHTGPTVTYDGDIDSRIMMVTPCGAADQPTAHKEILFSSSSEKLLIKPGEGIALYSETAGDVDQLVKMQIEWQETASAPAAGDEFIMSYPRVERNAAANEVYHTFFNPAGSGKYAIVRRMEARIDNDAVAAAINFSIRRITAASAGTQIVSTSSPKKNSSSSNSAMEFRYNQVTATMAGSVDSRLAVITAARAVSQISSRKEVVYEANEELILAPGEGVAFYTEAAGDPDNYVKFSIEWKETASPPTVTGKYAIDLVSLGQTTAYEYYSFFNPATSTKTAVIDKIWLMIDDDQNAPTFSTTSVWRITAASGGTQIAAANIPKKDSSSSNSLIEIRTTNPTVTLVGVNDARLISVLPPDAIGSAYTYQTVGHKSVSLTNREKLVLKPGEGIVLYQEVAGDVDYRPKLYIEWEEAASAPVTGSEYMFSARFTPGSLTSGYVYSSLFNPATSSNNYVVKSLGIRVTRTGGMSAPGYIPVSLRRITSASGGTLVAASDIPKKNSSTTNANAEIRSQGVTVTFASVSSSVGVIAPGATGQNYGTYVEDVVYGDELVLHPGEGLALYQESAAGDVAIMYSMYAEWAEVGFEQSGYRFFDNANSVSPGAPLAAQNTSTTLVSAGQPFRLRSLIHVSGFDSLIGNQSFKLQFAGKGTGTCALPVGTPSAYTDVTTSTLISFYDNASSTNGANISATSTDPTHGTDVVVPQTYVEGNNFSNSQSAILAGQDGLWDFALYPNAAPGNTSYCFRMVTANGQPLETATYYPEIKTTAGNLTVDIVDSGGVSVATPTMAFGNVSVSLTYRTSTAVFGSSTEKIRVTNDSANANWNLTIAATGGSTSTWVGVASSTLKYDFNDPTAFAVDGPDADSYGGQMSLDPTAGTLSPKSGCNNTGLTKGSAAGFSEGATNTITMLTAGTGAGTSCYWDFTGINVSQTIPARQNPDSYYINMTLTVTSY